MANHIVDRVAEWLESRSAIFRAIRPTDNMLEGYTPSYAMNRVAEEAM